MSELKQNNAMQQEIYIGARPLKDQIYMIMPTYDLLITQIEQIRTSAQQSSFKKGTSVVKKETNNTIGVFGSRGTGKTSAIYTIQEYLTTGNRKNENVLLPIIEPDNFGENTKIMGSIVGLLKKTVYELLKEIKTYNGNDNEGLSHLYNNCVLKDNNDLIKKTNELIEYHLYTESQYRTLLSQNYDDLASHIKKSSRLLIPDIKFKEKLTALINEIIQTKKQLHHNENEVLLFIFIDDIDLKTTKTRELVDSILQYANHPNVVTILSGDYEILTESLTMALLQDENLAVSGLSPQLSLYTKDEEDNKGIHMTIIQRKWQLAHEYLKKIIPPARRHQLVNWNLETIPYFSFGNITLASQLKTLMENNQIFIFNQHNSDKMHPIKNSFSIFDKKARGLVNVYYHIHQVNQLLSSTEYRQYSMEEQKKIKYINVKSLIDTIILSSTELADNQKTFFDKLIRWGNNSESSFIDYETTKLRLELFIVGEMIKTLLPNIRYDENAFLALKKELFSEYALVKNDRGTFDGDQIKKNASKWWYTPYYIVRSILIHSKARNALLLLEYLSQDNDKYYYENYYLSNRYQKDRIIFMSIYKVSLEDKNFLINLFDISHNLKVEEVNDCINFLTGISIVSSKFSITERIFGKLLSNFYNKNKDTQKNKEDYIKRFLFINTLIYLSDSIETNSTSKHNSNNLTSSIIVSGKDNLSKTFKILRKINENINERKSNSAALIRTLDTTLQNLGEVLYKRFESHPEKVEIVLNKEFKEEYLKFVNGTRNGSSTTKYHIVQTKLFYLTDNDLSQLKNIDIFTEMFKEIESLSQNNKIWYGRSEAIRFLSAIKRTACLNSELFFEGIESSLLQEFVKYESSNSAISEDLEFEEAKEDMRDMLESAYDIVRTNTAKALENFELTLEDDESDAEEN